MNKHCKNPADINLLDAAEELGFIVEVEVEDDDRGGGSDRCFRFYRGRGGAKRGYGPLFTARTRREAGVYVWGLEDGFLMKLSG